MSGMHCGLDWFSILGLGSYGGETDVNMPLSLVLWVLLLLRVFVFDTVGLFVSSLALERVLELWLIVVVCCI